MFEFVSDGEVITMPARIAGVRRFDSCRRLTFSIYIILGTIIGKIIKKFEFELPMGMGICFQGLEPQLIYKSVLFSLFEGVLNDCEYRAVTTMFFEITAADTEMHAVSRILAAKDKEEIEYRGAVGFDQTTIVYKYAG